MTIVLTTHYLEEAQRLCDRVAIVHAGQIAVIDTPTALLAGLGDELLELRVEGAVELALAALGAHGAAAADAFVVGSTLTVPLHDLSAGDRPRRGRPRRAGHQRHPHPAPNARRRLPAADRRSARRSRLTPLNPKGASHGHYRGGRCRAPARPRPISRPRFASALRTLAARYTAFVAVGTVGLLVPLATTFAGLNVLVDRDSGAQRELLAAPVHRALLLAGNLLVLGLCTLQVVVVIAAAALRGADFHIRAAGMGWFAAAAVLFVVLMYGIAETVAARIHSQEEYIGATPVIAILPWFFAGALFPIGALPAALTAFAKILPLTHAMALMRYGLVDPDGSGLHDIWGMTNTTTEAWLSLAVVAAFATAFGAVRSEPLPARRCTDMPAQHITHNEFIHARADTIPGVPAPRCSG